MAVEVLGFDPAVTRERQAARRWLALALAVLVLAGLFALAVVVGRTPPFDRFVTDPLFFKRCLVAHVNLALVAWFYSFLVSLLFLVPARRPAGFVARNAVHLGAGGVALMMAGAIVPAGRPVLANYIPTIDNPLFQSGQILFACGVMAAIATRRLWHAGGVPDEGTGISGAARSGMRATAIALGLAGATLALTAVRQARIVPTEVRAEFLVWGVGHVLQLVSVIGMVSAWILLLTPVLGRSPISPQSASALFLSILVPWTMAPLFALAGTESLAYRHGFTHLMRWCLFPILLVFLALFLGSIVAAWRRGRIGIATLREPGLAAFLVSAALTLLGFVLGALIRGSNTMVPAHYHASVGGVTVAFMAATYALLPVFRISIPRGWAARAAPWQSAIYGLGMLVFAGGFALAGAHGMGRKMYGAEQASRGVAETAGLALMGIGGLIAIVGGVLFLAIVARSWWAAARSPLAAERSSPTMVIPEAPVLDPPRALMRNAWRWPHDTRR